MSQTLSNLAPAPEGGVARGKAGEKFSTRPRFQIPQFHAEPPQTVWSSPPTLSLLYPDSLFPNWGRPSRGSAEESGLGHVWPSVSLTSSRMSPTLGSTFPRC